MDTQDNLAFNDAFRGFDYDCTRRQCFCLYDEGTLDNRQVQTRQFERINNNKNVRGKGRVGGTRNARGYFCGDRVQPNEFEEEFEDGVTASQ